MIKHWCTFFDRESTFFAKWKELGAKKFSLPMTFKATLGFDSSPCQVDPYDIQRPNVNLLKTQSFSHFQGHCALCHVNFEVVWNCRPVFLMFCILSPRWQCEHCTMHNEEGTRVCNVCDRTSDNPQMATDTTGARKNDIYQASQVLQEQEERDAVSADNGHMTLPCIYMYLSRQSSMYHLFR